MNKSSPVSWSICVGTILLQPLAGPAAAASEEWSGYAPPSPALVTNEYKVTNLTTNTSTSAANTDAKLVNPWGLARSSSGPWWVADNGSGLSTLYTGTGSDVPLVVTIPPAQAVSGNPGSPTGTIYNGTKEFAIAPGEPAAFLFATEDGTVSGWNPAVKPTNAVIAVNESAEGASFKGVTAARADVPGQGIVTLLYVADFTLGKVEIFDGTFKHQNWIEQRINQDDGVPYDYSPFNVQNLGGNIFVTYAKRGSGINEQDGPGFGRVHVFSPDGRLLMRLEAGHWFNAPWGVAIAPSDFGPYSHDILVGNFGSGWIAAFNPVTGKFEDFLRDAHGSVVTIPGLWGIVTGNDGSAGNATTLYFVAGGANEASGVLGTLTALQNPQGNDQ